MSLKRIKRSAKLIKKKDGVKYLTALDLAAQERGFKDYKDAYIAGLVKILLGGSNGQ